MSKKVLVGSICSGIEAASVAWKNLDFEFSWFSEIADFPSRFLALKYPEVKNLGDMCEIPSRLENNEIVAPDLICGGTPCQAFSLAGWKKGLEDTRGNLTLKFVDIIETNDIVRKANKKKPTVVFWENVEGVLKDKTNAFGIFISSLAGLEDEVSLEKWPRAGLIRGPKRNIAWRVLDAKYFGLPHQRRRLYVLAGGKDFHPENILFDKFPEELPVKGYEKQGLKFDKEGHKVEVFRSYTDCLYSAYGTKWNGNAAAYNGSLFVYQNERLRRLTPLECERLMGFPDNYTDIPKVKPTNRYQGVGNSWAVPVIKWIGERVLEIDATTEIDNLSSIKRGSNFELFDVSGSKMTLMMGQELNGTEVPENPKIGCLKDIIDLDAPENFYISPVGCKGILRRKEERGLTINPRLEEVLRSISSLWSDEKIEAISRVQTRGRFSTPNSMTNNSEPLDAEI